MPLLLRPTATRGHTDLGWLDSRHSFSFGGYHDPAWMGFRTLRVINDDHVAPGGGFDLHPHRDMEIITYVLAGTLAHTDTLGHTEQLLPGWVQAMTAGRGLQHSEFNPSATTGVHFLQIWLLPRARGLPPAYQQRQLAPAAPNTWQPIAGPEASLSPLLIQQDATLYRAHLAPGSPLAYPLNPTRGAYLHIISGTLTLNHKDKEIPLTPGDAAALTETPSLTLTATTPTEALLFDLP
jgi:redox-sensitive bicupin YhaK (pirin superfamily)